MQPPLFELYARRDSVLHRRDARLKLVVAVALVIGLVAIPPGWTIDADGVAVKPAWVGVAALALLTVVLYGLSRLPWGFLVRRVLGLAPFAALLTTPVPLARGWHAGWEPAALLLCRALTAFALMTVLVCTTPVPALLTAMRRLRVPALPVSVAAFMYRYLFVLAGELERMRRAKLARSFRADRRGDWKLLPRFIAVLFVRAFERADRVHSAMCARGWDGRPR
jgi:cobalt/nickel transport system permease protein